jgi:hypothetical protein
MFFKNPKIAEQLNHLVANSNIFVALGAPFCRILEKKISQKQTLNREQTLQTIIQQIANEEITVNLKKLINSQLITGNDQVSRILNEAEFTDKKYSYLKNAYILYEMIHDKKNSQAIMVDLSKSQYFKNVALDAFKSTPQSNEPIKLTNVSKTLSSHQAIQQQWKLLADTALASKQKKILSVSSSKKAADVVHGAIMLSQAERVNYAVSIKNGVFVTANNQLFDTRDYTSHEKNGYAAYVMNTSGELSVFDHLHGKGLFYHSSVNAGKSVIAAGELNVSNGKLISITQYSGHYQPSLDSMLSLLNSWENEMDMSHVTIVLISKLPLTQSLNLTYQVQNGMHTYKASELLEHAVTLKLYATQTSIFKTFPKHFDPLDDLQTNTNSRQILLQLSPADRGLMLGLTRLYRQLDPNVITTHDQIDKLTMGASRLIDNYKLNLIMRVQRASEQDHENEISPKILLAMKESLFKFDLEKNLNSVSSQLMELSNLNKELSSVEMSQGNFDNASPAAKNDFIVLSAMRSPLIHLLNDMEIKFLDYSNFKQPKKEADKMRIDLASNYFKVMIDVPELMKKVVLADSPEKLQNLAVELTVYYDQFKSEAKHRGIGRFKKGKLSGLIEEFSEKIQEVKSKLDDPKQLIPEPSTKIQQDESASLSQRHRKFS